MNSQRGMQRASTYRSAERRLGVGGLAIVLALAAGATASAQTTLYRNSLSSSNNIWTNTAGWSVSGTASKAAPTSVGTSDTLVFSNFWTPQRASGLAIWLDAADPNTVVGGTADNAVTAWNDKSGNGRNAVSASNGQPTYQANSQNGNNTLRFNGDSMQAPFVTNPTALTYFMVYQRNGNGSSGFDFYLDIGVQQSTDDNNGRFAQQSNQSSPNTPEYFASAVLAANADRPVGITSSPLNQNWNLHASTGVFTTGSQSLEYAINGGVVGTTTGTGANRTGTTVYRIGNGGTWSGTQDQTNLRANGTIAETLTYSAALSTADRQLVEGYLAWKWGTVGSLPADHPYKSAPPTAASDTVYLGGNQAAAGLQFATGATTLLGGTNGGAAANSLALGSGGLTVSAGAGAVTLGTAGAAAVDLVLGASQAWTNDSGSLLRAHNGVSRASGDTTNRVLTVSGSGNTRLDGLIANGGASGTLGLTKSGAGVLTLTGSSTYTGATNVSAGSLLVNGQLGNTAVTVNSGGLLGGSGSILGSVSVLAGGTFSPGNSPELFSVGSLSLAGTTLMEIDGVLPRGAAGGYDATNVTGLLTYGGSLLIDFGADISSALPNDTTFDLFAFGSYTGGFSSITTAADGSFYGGLSFASTGGGDKWTATKGQQTLEFTHSTGNLVIVPEPGVIALAGLGIAAAAWAARRRP